VLFNSPFYIFVFLPIVLIIYFSLNKMRFITLGKAWMVLASLYFYGYWNPAYLFLIIASMLVNFGIGNALHKTKEKNTSFLSRKKVLIIGIVLNLSVLAYYKYSDFFIFNMNELLGIDAPLLNLLLPLAISFFTFQQIAYLVDCYQFDTQEYDFLSYCLFVSFFPQLIAGPIVHHKEMMPQFSNLRNVFVNYRNISKGLLIFSIGLFKKVVIADTFAIWANQGFDATIPLSFFEAWGASLSYTFQLYYDFSGYSDMAIGVALMFNIRLPLNFNSPYKAKSIQDFWRRWHMTLSRWLRDYLYIPLGGNRIGVSRTYFNLMATFVLGGLWHGAGWTFILWGALHGSALAIHRFWQTFNIKMPSIVAWTLTFLFINFTWIFFRANDVSSALSIIEGMFGLNGIHSTGQFVNFMHYFVGWKPDWIIMNGNKLVGSVATIQMIVLFGFIAFFAKNTIELCINKNKFTIRDSLTISLSLILTVLLGIASSASEFLYFNF
jgi:alginate O-acetyltransferase complex protein AlgI